MKESMWEDKIHTNTFDDGIHNDHTHTSLMDT